MANEKSEYRIPGVTGFTDGNKTIGPDKKGIYHITDAQVELVRGQGFNVTDANADDEAFEKDNQPGSKRGPAEVVDSRQEFHDPNETKAKMGKVTPRAKVAAMTADKGRPASMYPAEDVTIYPDAKHRKKKVVVVAIENGEDIVNPNLDSKGVAKLLKEFGLRQKEVDVSKSPWVDAADVEPEPEAELEPENQEDPEPEGEALKATLYPGATPEDGKTLVLDDGDGDPEIHEGLKNSKAINKLLKEAELDRKNPDEFEEVDTPYEAPEE